MTALQSNLGTILIGVPMLSVVFAGFFRLDERFRKAGKRRGIRHASPAPRPTGPTGQTLQSGQTGQPFLVSRNGSVRAGRG